MFAHRSKYSSQRIGNIIILEDLNGAKSLTNDMETVISELFMEHSDIKACTIIYGDSGGLWDKVIVKGVSQHHAVVDLEPIKPGTIIKSREQAIKEVGDSIE